MSCDFAIDAVDLMLLGYVHEVFDNLELEFERSTRDCNWQSVKYLQGIHVDYRVASAYVRNMSPS